MSRTARTAVELPSGLFRGYYEQYGAHYPQEMTVELADGVVRGDGSDDIGEFTLEGEYRAGEGEVRIGWIKTYLDAHSVLYLGTLEPGGRLRGRWSIRDFYSGGFLLDLAAEHELR